MNWPGQHEALLGKIEVKDAVAGRGVVRLLQPVPLGERAADRRLLLVLGLAGEDEVIVGDRRLARIDEVAAGDLVERVDRERRRAVGGRQQIRVDAQRESGLEVLAVRGPGRRGAPRRSARSTSCRGRASRPASPAPARSSIERAQFPPAHGEDAAAPADLFFLRRERHGDVRPALRHVRDRARDRIERELVVVVARRRPPRDTARRAGRG